MFADKIGADKIADKIFIFTLIVVIIFFIYETVHNLWTIDICISYYQKYGNFNYTIPLTDRQTNTWDCYHEALSKISFDIIALLASTLLLGIAIGHINSSLLAFMKN